MKREGKEKYRERKGGKRGSNKVSKKEEYRK